ncbi:hypothetical protein K2X05_10475 [bacterium]|nr:hypothetical protein [bacterium]
MTKHLETIKKHKEVAVFAILFFIVLIFYSCQKESNPKTSTENPTEANDGIDLLIPAGQSLVPIEVANYETLDSLLGSFGVVDLFFVDPLKPEMGKKIASMVKIVRAPKNPSHFAVLVPSLQAQKILQFKGPLVVSVQNPKHQTGTQFEIEKKEKRSVRRSRIIYE